MTNAWVMVDGGEYQWVQVGFDRSSDHSGLLIFSQWAISSTELMDRGAALVRYLPYAAQGIV